MPGVDIKPGLSSSPPRSISKGQGYANLLQQVPMPLPMPISGQSQGPGFYPGQPPFTFAPPPQAPPQFAPAPGPGPTAPPGVMDAQPGFPQMPGGLQPPSGPMPGPGQMLPMLPQQPQLRPNLYGPPMGQPNPSALLQLMLAAYGARR